MTRGGPRPGAGRPTAARRGAAIVVRVTDAERAELHARAARVGLTVSEWLRRLALGPPPSPPT